MFKVDSKNSRTTYKFCSKLTIKTPERIHRYFVCIDNLKQISSGKYH